MQANTGDRTDYVWDIESRLLLQRDSFERTDSGGDELRGSYAYVWGADQVLFSTEEELYDPSTLR